MRPCACSLTLLCVRNGRPLQSRSSGCRPLGLYYSQKSAASLRNRLPRLSRVFVKSDSLCDDALATLSTSLESWKGCDIVDFLPGNGLWSIKIHKVLQPRSHALIEPDISGLRTLPIYKDPECRLEQHATPDAASIASVLRSAIRGPSKSLGPSAKQASKIEDRPLLILATLSHTAKYDSVTFASTGGRPQHHSDAPLARSKSSAKVFLDHVITALQSKSPEQRRQVRILAWVLDNDVHNILPRTVGGRSGHVMEVEEAFEVSEVVGSGHETKAVARARQPDLDVYSTSRVAEKMVANSHIPTTRQSAMLKIVSKIPTNPQILLSDSKSWILRVRDHVMHLLHWSQLRFVALGGLKGKSPPSERDAETKRSEVLERQSASSLMKRSCNAFYRAIGRKLTLEERVRFEAVLMIWLAEHERLQRKSPRSIDIVSKSPGQEAHVSLKSRVGQVRDLITKVARKRDSNHPGLTMYADNYASLHRTTPLLAWDQREREPLTCKANEFDPQVKLALLDFKARSEFPRPVKRGSSTARVILSRHPFINSLRYHSNTSIGEALETIMPGCREAILPKCRTLSDIRHGGRIDPNDMRVRMLTEDMWRELLEAWYSWPFHKSDEELPHVYRHGKRTADKSRAGKPPPT